MRKVSRKTKSSKAILITEHGLQNQKPIGMVTTWDLIRINHINLLE